MSLPDTSVKYFDSTMSGAPVLSGTAGALIAVLDACLVTGFGTVTLDSLTVTDNVATATVSAGHNFPLVGGVIGSVIEISGATPPALNGQWRIATVPSSTTFTFTTSGIANGNATGAITAKRAAAGWERRYSGTNKAAYARPDPVATAMLLRVDDTGPGSLGAMESRWRGYEAMSDVDTGSGLFPAVAQIANGMIVQKSSTLDAVARPWVLAANHTGFWLIPRFNPDYAYGNLRFFGDLSYPRRPADAFHCVIHASREEGYATTHPNHSSAHFIDLQAYDSASSSGYLPRRHDQTGAAVGAQWSGDHCVSTRWGDGGYAHPTPHDNGIRCSPVTCHSQGLDRGLFPGIYQALHTRPGNHGDVVTVADATNTGRSLLLVAVAATHTERTEGRALIDLSGPW